MTGKLAVSRSGHDKGRIYVIVREEEENVFLSDGKLKLIEKPKKKNKKHIQIIKNLPLSIEVILRDMETVKNEEIKRALRLYRKELLENRNELDSESGLTGGK